MTKLITIKQVSMKQITEQVPDGKDAVSNVLSAKDKYFAVEWNPHEVQSKGCC